MNMIQRERENSNGISQELMTFVKRLKVNDILCNYGLVKKCGVSALAIFMFIMGLVFTKKNMYRLYESGKNQPEFGKDATYRLLNNQSINWEKILAKTGYEAIAEIKDLTDKDTRRYALIADDTPHYRDRSKKVELLSRCKDHSEDRYYNGFTDLVLGWSDGVSFVPVDMRVVASSNDENLIEGSHVKEDGRTIATRRRRDAVTSKPQLLLDMLAAAKETPAHCKYVLFDSWYANPKSFFDITKLGYSVCARLKKNATKYRCNGELLDVSTIYRQNKKRPGKSKYLLSVEISIEHKDYEGAIPARLVFVRNKNTKKKKDWIVLISTDMSLGEEEVIALYGKRWAIETFFKVCKNDLKMCKEFQSRSFDAVVGHTVIVFIRYIMLSIANREQKDNKTICEIFHRICDELEDIRFDESLSIIFEIMTECADALPHTEKLIWERFYNQFIAMLPDYIAEKLAA
jgi:hypothetical protein